MMDLSKGAAIAVALALTACGPPQSAPNITAPPRAEFESQRLEVMRVGQGPDVILIPGLASNAAVWDGVTGSLKDRFTFHVVQVSGFGGAPARGNVDKVNVLDGLAEELVRYTETLSSPPAIIGHSLGGLVALKVGLRKPVQIDRLMAIDVLPFFSVLIDPDATSRSMTPVAAMAKMTLIGQSDEAFAAGQEAALTGLVKDQLGRQTALAWSIASDRKVMAQAMFEVMVLDLRDQISQLDVPLTVLFARDPTVPNMHDVEALYRDLYAPAPQGEVVAVDGAYHFIMFDQEEVFLEEIENFLDADRRD